MRTKSLLGCIIASPIALFIATLIVPNVWIEGGTSAYVKTLIFAGIVLGLINFFIKPIIKLITFPLKYLTLGLIGLIINIVIIWVIDLLFPSLHIQGLLSLFLVSIIVWFVNLFIPKKKKEPKMEPIE